MTAKRFRRKDLKQDEFVSKTTRMTRWLMQRRRRIGWGLLVVIVVASVAAGVWTYRARQEERAAAQLAEALKIYRAPVVQEDGGGPAGDVEGAPRPAGAADAGDGSGTDGRTFSTEEGRYRAAREALEPVVAEYGDTPSGRIGSFYLGICQAALGDREVGVESLRRAAGSSKPLISALARYRLGTLLLDSGEPLEAASIYEELVDSPGGYFPAAEALMAKARAHEAADDPEAALSAYRRVVDEHSGSAYVADARQRAEELAAELGLEPEPETS